MSAAAAKVEVAFRAKRRNLLTVQRSPRNVPHPMNSFAVKLSLGAALFSLPLASHAQRNLGSGSIGPAVRHDVTLLTGPYFLSPASPPKSPVEGQEWTFVKRGTTTVSAPAQGRLILGSGHSGNSNVTFTGTTSLDADAEIADARQKLEAAKQRLERLQAERAAALQLQKELDEAPEFVREGNRNRVRLRGRPTAPLLPEDPIRFDARMPDAPRLRLSKPEATEPPVKRD
jgi:hypothetical protein